MSPVKRRVLSIATALTALFACAFSFTACGFDSDVPDVPDDPEKPAAHFDAENYLTKKGICVSRYNGKENTSSAQKQTYAQKVEALNPSWYYTWGVKPNNEYIDAEFVPMIWGGWQMTQENLDYVKENYENGKFSHLLTFNEPDLRDQANLTVEQALGYWEQLEEIGIPLSSPVVSWYINGNPWLDEFMEKAEERGLRVDFIAVHTYQPFYLDGQVESLKRDTLDVLYEKYHKPIWVTEIGAIDTIAREINAGKLMVEMGCTEESAQKYIAEATAMFESCGYVERYSWFLDNLSEKGSARPYEAVYTSLYNDNDTIAATGETYRGVQSHFPLMIETEYLPLAQFGQSYSHTVLACGGTGDYIFTAEGLPEGLTIFKGGKITGKPEDDGVFEIKITVTDEELQTRTYPFTLVVT